MGRAAALILGLAATGLVAAFLWWLLWKVAGAARRAYLRYQMSPAEREILDNRAKRVEAFLKAERARDNEVEAHLRDKYRL